MKDTTFAWSCAANLLLYDADPGPREVDVGSGSEQRLVDRYEALVNVYARQVLVELEADVARIEALEHACEREAAETWTLRRAWEAARHRRRHGATRRGSLAALTRRSRRDIVEVWLIAAEIVAEAGRIVRDAGADPDSDADGKARGRLLASTNHSLTFDILGAFLPADVEQQAADDLAEDLRQSMTSSARGDEVRRTRAVRNVTFVVITSTCRSGAGLAGRGRAVPWSHRTVRRKSVSHQHAK